MSVAGDSGIIFGSHPSQTLCIWLALAVVSFRGRWECSLVEPVAGSWAMGSQQLRATTGHRRRDLSGGGHAQVESGASSSVWRGAPIRIWLSWYRVQRAFLSKSRTASRCGDWRAGRSKSCRKLCNSEPVTANSVNVALDLTRTVTAHPGAQQELNKCYHAQCEDRCSLCSDMIASS